MQQELHFGLYFVIYLTSNIISIIGNINNLYQVLHQTLNIFKYSNY